mmetsp:Transcript_24693/g.18699  ORF Transcript_24693/g.18699 Transcript_24693/m.18699 type:complete len:85 (+) Transcript_24693:333-587(+)
MKKKAQTVTLTSVSSEVCPSGKYGRYSINYLIACEPYARRSQSNDFILKDDPCSPTIMINHQAGCPLVTKSEFFGLNDPISVIK